jgi:hypothetical protein
LRRPRQAAGSQSGPCEEEEAAVDHHFACPSKHGEDLAAHAGAASRN